MEAVHDKWESRVVRYPLARFGSQPKTMFGQSGWSSTSFFMTSFNSMAQSPYTMEGLMRMRMRNRCSSPSICCSGTNRNMTQPPHNHISGTDSEPLHLYLPEPPQHQCDL
jgi:hypothetical protein